jgi:hypothetical protein
MQLLFKDTYVAMIKNSVHTSMFKNFFIRRKGKKTDILRDGDLSCASFVSSVLTLFNLIETPHATVRGTLYDMKKSGWYEIKRPKIGCILMWDKKYYEKSGEAHAHIGFYIGNATAVSNSSKKKTPTTHSYKMQDGRPLTGMYWHPKLDVNHVVISPTPEG